MSENSQKNIPSWLLLFPELDSTNSCAIRRIDEGLSVHGEVIMTNHQTKGRGQWQKVWHDQHEKSILASLILKEHLENISVYSLSLLVPLVIATEIASLFDSWNVTIKWPNDIYVNDKKAAGILIENSFRGNKIQYIVVGFGINMAQTHFDTDLPNATSLFLESKKTFDRLTLLSKIRNRILSELEQLTDDSIITLVKKYNAFLFKKDTEVTFESLAEQTKFSGVVIGVNPQFQLQIQVGNKINAYEYGSLKWCT